MAAPSKNARRKTPQLVEKMTTSMRLPVGLKERLDDAAKTSGRSLTQEIELRLARSFEREELLPEVLTLVYGPEVGGLLMAAGSVMTVLGRSAAQLHTPRDLEFLSRWIEEPYAFDQAMRGVVDLLDRARPAGDLTTNDIRPDTTEMRPLLYAGEMARAIAGNGYSGWAEGVYGKQNIRAIRTRLGKIAERLRKDGPKIEPVQKSKKDPNAR